MQIMYSVGTDIIEVERVKTLIDKYGDKFLNKIFTSNEITYCESHKIKANLKPCIPLFFFLTHHEAASKRADYDAYAQQ